MLYDALQNPKLYNFTLKKIQIRTEVTEDTEPHRNNLLTVLLERSEKL